MGRVQRSRRTVVSTYLPASFHSALYFLASPQFPVYQHESPARECRYCREAWRQRSHRRTRASGRPSTRPAVQYRCGRPSYRHRGPEQAAPELEGETHADDCYASFDPTLNPCITILTCCLQWRCNRCWSLRRYGQCLPDWRAWSCAHRLHYCRWHDLPDDAGAR